MSYKLESVLLGEMVNNLKYGDDTTLTVENKEELKSFLMRVKGESEKADLKLNIQQINYGIQSHHFMTNRWGKKGNSGRYYFLVLQNHCRQ